jgi:hypothetical protein
MSKGTNSDKGELPIKEVFHNGKWITHEEFKNGIRKPKQIV